MSSSDSRRQGLLEYDNLKFGSESVDEKRLRRIFLGLDGDPGTTTVAAAAPDLAMALLDNPPAKPSPETPTSLATCEKVSESAAVSGFSEGGLSEGNELKPVLRNWVQLDTLWWDWFGDVWTVHRDVRDDGVSDALEGTKDLDLQDYGDEIKILLRYVDDVDRAARLLYDLRGTGIVYELPDTNPARREKVIALVEAGELSHARQLLNCRKKSVQMECPDDFGAGGCGSKDNYVPINCDSRLCPTCMKRKMGKIAGQYTPVVEDWDHPTMLRLSLDRRVPTDDLETAVDALRGAHGRLRKRVIPASGDGWTWEEWKKHLRMVGRTDLARRWQKRYVSQGKGIPFKEAVPTGFYGIDIKQGHDGSLNVHMHVLADVPWLPQAALSDLWDQLTDAPVVDIRRVDGSEEGALMEVVGYAAKAPEYETLDDEISYFQTLKGSKLIQPFGDLHGNAPTVPAQLLCCDCGMSPRWWNYLGTVRGEYNTVEVGGVDGDRPPPGGA